MADQVKPAETTNHFNGFVKQFCSETDINSMLLILFALIPPLEYIFAMPRSPFQTIYKLLCLAILCLLTALLSPLFATTVIGADNLILLENGARKLPLHPPQLEYLEDQGGKFSIDDVTKPPVSGRFIPVSQNIPNFGMSGSAYWFRFSVAKHSDTDQRWLLQISQPMTEEADLYSPRPNGSYHRQESGVGRSISARPQPERSIIFPLSADSNRKQFYLRLMIKGRAIFPLALVTEREQRWEATLNNSLMALVSGFMLAMALIGLVLYLFMRIDSYLFFILYLLASLLTLLSITGYYYAIFLPDHPAIHRMTLLLPAVLMNLAALLFTGSFLKLSSHSAKMGRLLRILLAISLLLLPLHLLLPPLQGKILINLLYLLVSIFSALAAYICLKKGYSAARYFLLSRIVVYLGGISFALLNFNLIPAGLLPGNLMLTIFMLDALFMAIALADQVNSQKGEINRLVQQLRNEITRRDAADQAVEQQLVARQLLEQEIIRVSDEERRRISQEIHDGLCQQLTGARLLCSTLASRLGGKSDSSHLLEPLNRLLDESVDQAYRLSRGIWPIEQELPGMEENFRRFIGQISELSGIQILFHKVDSCSSCSYPHQTQLYRIAQEAVVNAVKHAAATVITVNLNCREGGEILLEVNDNGRWSDQGNGGEGGGLGLRIMAHRAATLDGRIELKRRPNGTSLICSARCPATGGGNHE